MKGWNIILRAVLGSFRSEVNFGCPWRATTVCLSVRTLAWEVSCLGLKQ